MEPKPENLSIEETITLFRPVGQKEMELIRQSGDRTFPPRLPFQPIFYPVLYQDYAVQIARDWNTKDAASGYVGYVTRFRLPWLEPNFCAAIPSALLAVPSIGNTGFPPKS